MKDCTFNTKSKKHIMLMLSTGIIFYKIANVNTNLITCLSCVKPERIVIIVKLFRTG